MLEDAREGVSALVSLARQAPELAARTERLSREIDEMAEHGLRFDEETARAIGKAEARATRWGRVALWVIALALVWIAWQACASNLMLALIALLSLTSIVDALEHRYGAAVTIRNLADEAKLRLAKAGGSARHFDGTGSPRDARAGGRRIRQAD